MGADDVCFLQIAIEIYLNQNKNGRNKNISKSVETVFDLTYAISNGRNVADFKHTGHVIVC